MGLPTQRLMGIHTKTQLPTLEALLKPKIVKEAVTVGLEEYKMRQKHYYNIESHPLPSIEN